MTTTSLEPRKPRRKRLNPWTPQAIAGSALQRERLAQSLERVSPTPWRAHDVRLCGTAEVGTSPDGNPVAARCKHCNGAGCARCVDGVGHTAARVFECGHRLCAYCAARVAKKAAAAVRKKLVALDNDRAAVTRAALEDARADLARWEEPLALEIAELTDAPDLLTFRAEKWWTHPLAPHPRKAVRHALEDGSTLGQKRRELHRLRLKVGRTKRRAQASARFNTRAVDRQEEKRSTLQNLDVRLFTLSQADRPGESAADSFDRLSAALRVLTRSADWGRHVDGALIKIETERSTRETREKTAQWYDDLADQLDAEGKTRKAAEKRAYAATMRTWRGEWWHTHAHVMAIGCYWHQRQALATWRACLVATGLCGPDIERVERGAIKDFGGFRLENPRKDILREVTKYVTKPLAMSQLSDDDLDDLHRALRKRRLMRCTGVLYGLKLDEEAPPAVKCEGEEPAALEDADPIVGVDIVTGELVTRAAVRYRSDSEAVERRRAHNERVWNVNEHHRRNRPWPPPPAEPHPPPRPPPPPQPPSAHC